MSNKIKVGIVEDEHEIRDMLIYFINQQPDMECVLHADSVESFFIALADVPQLHVLIQDIGLPGMSGLDAIRKIREKLPRTEILMYSIFDDSDRIFKALCAGASGYILKNTRLEDIRRSILDVHNGQAAMSPSIAKKVIAYFRPQKTESQLTDKEQMVVQLLTDGLSYKMVADRMQVSMNTVRFHIRNIYDKLQVHSKAEVISRNLRGDI
ncbi:MAG: response regulator transcription factor [Saprospiraceae bacterium]|nr:response regulator transcription factor [Candidatus Opimibacter iunctus]